MAAGHNITVLLQKSICIFRPSLVVGVIVAGLVDVSHVFYMFRNLAIAEKILEVGVFERIVVGERNLVDMISVNERFFGYFGSTRMTSHLLRD
jgi:hypothetical protein